VPEPETMLDTSNAKKTGFVCPDCRTPLADLSCSRCGIRFAESDGIPELFSRDGRFASFREFGATYDEIYSHRTAVWEDQGRTPEFIRYFSNLAAALSTGSVLEIGCGEGFLLSAIQSTDKSAIDISAAALRQARQRAQASYCVAGAERLPFADDRFDLVVSVGVMEHFLDDREATTEIRRVLRAGGHYLVLIHTGLSFSQRLAQKVREYVFPRPRPIALSRWLGSKLYRPVHQPIQREYTRAAAQDCLEQCGLRVEDTLSLETTPDAPLGGPHVVIYRARK
jgi:SAM-dependent methyltransferase